jgi:DNA-binding transcriptional LysR family regulator
MKLTEEGQALFRTSMQARELEGRLSAELRNSAVEQDVDLAITGPGGLIARRLIPQCAGVFHKWPRLNLRFIAENKSDRLNSLKRGKVDLAVILPNEVPNELDSKRIAPTEFVLVAPAAWKDRSLTEILNKERLISYHQEDELALQYLRRFDLEIELRRPRLFANENEAILSLLMNGLGFALLPHDFVSSHIEHGNLVLLNGGETDEIPFALVWYPRQEMPIYLKELIAAIK